MSRIVILTRSFLDNQSANAICAGNIMHALKNDGHDVRLICLEKQYFNEHAKNVYPIYSNESTSNHRFLKIIKKCRIIFGDTKSVFNARTVEKYYEKLVELNNISEIDLVIAMYFPFESAQAIKQFKSTNPDVKAVVYELDSADDGIVQSRYKCLFNHTYRKWLKSVYRTVDRVIVMQSHVSHWERIFAKRFCDKMRVADIPMLLSHDDVEIKKEHTDRPYFIYSGLVMKKFRSPTYLLSVLKELCKHIAFRFDFFSRGDCENEISAASKEINGIFQNGYVSSEELDKVLADADCFVSIGNSVSNSLPSKLINYISYGKRIIHFASQMNDVCKKYLKRYPLALIIDASCPVSDSCAAIIDFLHRTSGNTVNFDLIKKEYILNMPEYSCKLIISNK